MRAAMPVPDWSPLLRTPVFETTALLVGLLFGSFANVCIHRLPADYVPAPGRLGWLRDLGRQLASVVYPPSHCPRCGRPIQPWDNVPLVSILVLRGRCRACGAPISLRYPAVEAANGLLWLGLAWRYGPRPSTVIEMLLATALLVLVLIDLDHQLLPDAVTVPGVLVGVAAAFLPGWPVSPLEAVASAAGAYLGFALLAWSWRRLRGIEALGRGDWKMAAMLGAFLGWDRLLLTLVLASAAGSIVGVGMIVAGRGRWQSKLPLGSFLGAAGIVVLFLGRRLLCWYGGLFRG